jgi:hypothetical protein
MGEYNHKYNVWECISLRSRIFFSFSPTKTIIIMFSMAGGKEKIVTNLKRDFFYFSQFPHEPEILAIPARNGCQEFRAVRYLAGL